MFKLFNFFDPSGPENPYEPPDWGEFICRRISFFLKLTAPIFIGVELLLIVMASVGFFPWLFVLIIGLVFGFVLLLLGGLIRFIEKLTSKGGPPDMF